MPTTSDVSAKLIFPTKETYSKLHLFDPKALFNPDYKVKWQKLLGA